MPICPVCRVPISRVPYEGVKVFNCGQCGGNWLTNLQVEHILATREVQMPAAVQEKMAALAEESNSAKALLCISCSCTMKKEGFRFWPELQLDHCPKCHGVWFDRGELEKAQILWERYQDDPNSVSNPAARARMIDLEAQLRLEVEQTKQVARDAKDAADVFKSSGGYGYGYGGANSGFGALISILARFLRPG